MSAEDVVKKVDEISDYLTLHEEAQLADYGETAAGGPYIKLRVPDHDALQVFRGKDRASKTKQGTRYILMLIELQDDETPVNNARRERMEQGIQGGALSKNAALLCKDSQFIEFLNAERPRGDGVRWHTENTKSFVYSNCGINSRAELDHNQDAARRYLSFVRARFWDWLQENDRL